MSDRIKELLKLIPIKRVEVAKLAEKTKVMDECFAINIRNWKNASDELFELGTEFQNLTRRAR